MKHIVGLFGTCGNSTWRDSVTDRLQKENITFFNPQKDGWSEADALIEAQHLATDSIVVMPITDETYGSASLAEVCICALKAFQDPNRTFITFIAPQVQDVLKEHNPQCAKESNNARKIVLAHLSKVNLPNFKIAKSLDEMLELTLRAAKQ